MSKDFGKTLEGLSFYMPSGAAKPKSESMFSKWFAADTGDLSSKAQPESNSIISTIAQGIKSKTGSGFSALRSVYDGSANTGRRLKFFFLFLAIAIVCLVSAFMFLPVVLLFPQKFGLMFSLGSICVHVSLSYLRSGPLEYLWGLISSKDTFLLSFIYFGSLYGTVWAAVVWGSYLWVLGFTSLQAGSIVWFFFSLFPGGTEGLKTVMNYGLGLCWPFGGKSSLPLPV